MGVRTPCSFHSDIQIPSLWGPLWLCWPIPIFFYLKFSKLTVYAVQFTGVSIFLSWSNCLISSTFMQAGWMPTDIRLGTGDYLSFKTSTVLLILISGALAWESSNNLHFEQDDVVASNLRSTGPDSQVYLLSPDGNYETEIMSPFLCLYYVKSTSRHQESPNYQPQNYQAFFSKPPSAVENAVFLNASIFKLCSLMSRARWFIPYTSVKKKKIPMMCLGLGKSVLKKLHEREKSMLTLQEWWKIIVTWKIVPGKKWVWANDRHVR